MPLLPPPSVLHVEDPEAAKESGLTHTDQRLLTGVLEYKGRTWVGAWTNAHEGRAAAALRGRGLGAASSVVRGHCP